MVLVVCVQGGVDKAIVGRGDVFLMENGWGEAGLDNADVGGCYGGAGLAAKVKLVGYAGRCEAIC